MSAPLLPGLWMVAALVPLMMALAIAVIGIASDDVAHRGRRVLTRLAPLAVLPAAWLGLSAEDGERAEAPWLLIGVSFEIDGIGRPLLVMTAALYAVALIIVARSKPERGPALSGLLLLCFAANAGVFVAADVVSLYLCFTVMSLVGYALVIHNRTSAARRAGRIYLTLAVAGEAAVLIASMLVVHAGGMNLVDAPQAVAGSEHASIIVALLWVGFGIKVGTVPLHVWLPLAHPAAPTPASAVLSGAMIAGGLAGWLRMLPLGDTTMTGWGWTFLATGVIGAYAAVGLGVLQGQAKAVLAYSSISQMGALSILVGLALLRPDLATGLIAAAVLYAVHHGAVKAALFFAVGLWERHGGGHLRWLVTGGFAIAGVSLAGLPLTGGYLAKYAAKDATADATLAGIEVATLLALVGAGSTILIARTGWLLLKAQTSSERVDTGALAWLALVLGSVPLVVWAAGAGSPVSTPDWFDAAAWWSNLWPIGVGAVAAGGGLWLSRREMLPPWLGHPDGRTVPPGDMVIAEERLASGARASVAAAASALGAARVGVERRLGRVPSAAAPVAKVERRLEHWVPAGVMLVGLFVVLAVLVWWSA